MLISCLSKCCWLLSRHLKYNRFHPGPLAISSFVEPMRLKGFSLLFCLYKTLNTALLFNQNLQTQFDSSEKFLQNDCLINIFYSFSSAFNNSNQGLSKHLANICHSFDMPIRSCQKFVNLFCSPIFFLSPIFFAEWESIFCLVNKKCENELSSWSRNTELEEWQ